jgi:hypothetical protein
VEISRANIRDGSHIRADERVYVPVPKPGPKRTRVRWPERSNVGRKARKVRVDVQDRTEPEVYGAWRAFYRLGTGVSIHVLAREEGVTVESVRRIARTYGAKGA